MNKTRLILLCAASVALCTRAQDDAHTPDAAPVRHSDLSSLATPQSFTVELREVYLTRIIDEMGSVKSETRRSSETTSSRRTTSESVSALMGLSSTHADSKRVENRGNTHASIKAGGELKWGLIPSGSVGAGIGHDREKSNSNVRESLGTRKTDATVSFGETHEHAGAESLEKRTEGAEESRLGKYHLRFSVVFRNHDPTDTLRVDGSRMRARLSGTGLTGTISSPYLERSAFSLGLGETVCSFDCEINDKRQLHDLLKLDEEGSLAQRLKLDVTGADLPIVSEKTGKNVIDERNAMERRRPGTHISIEFGELENLSPWTVSRLHTAASGAKGSPVTLREALLAVGDEAGNRSDVLPDNVFVFSKGGILEKIVNRPLLDKTREGMYRAYALRFTEADGKTELHLPLQKVCNDRIENYSKIFVFSFTFDEFAEMSVLHPVYFANIQKELQEWLAESGAKEAAKAFTALYEQRQREEDVRELNPDELWSITNADAERYRLRAEAGVPEMQLKYAFCLLGGFGVESNHVEAVKWMSKAAGKGYGEAQLVMGVLCQLGWGVEQNGEEAVKWYRKAAEQGQIEALCLLGDCYLDGIGVASNHVEAVKWYRKAAEKGEAGAQCLLADCYRDGIGVAEDLDEAVKWYLKAADQGEVDAIIFLADCYLLTDNHSEAFAWYRKAAELGHAGAQFAVGKCYFNGDGVKQDEGKAVEWVRKAAEQGYAEAQCSLGFCYSSGTGVVQDFDNALKWTRLAAEQGYAEAQNNLGFYYENGRGVKQDDKEAIKWYRKAAEQGLVESQLTLAAYYDGEQNYTEAVKWVRKAAEQGNAQAQCALGIYYRDGVGVKRDYGESFNWLKKAAEQGNAEALSLLDGK